MSEFASAQPRTWRPIALWSASILLAIGLAWFVGAVVVPVWQVERAMAKYMGGYGHYPEPNYNLSSVIEDLGGEPAAARKISVYMTLPDCVARRKVMAFYPLKLCGAAGVPPLRALLEKGDDVRRLQAIGELQYIAFTEDSAVSALTSAARDRSDLVRCELAKALGFVACERMRAGRPLPKDLMVTLTSMLADPDREVRAAAEALKMIRGEEPPK